MTTARYPKQVLLERIDAKIAGLADEQALEESEQLTAVRQFNTQTELHLDKFYRQVEQLQSEHSLTREVFGRAEVTDAEKYKQAAKLSSAVSDFNSNWPSPGWRSHSYKEELKKIEKRYEVKRRFLEGKRSIIESADAPDGFTMTALEKLHLLEAIG